MFYFCAACYQHQIIKHIVMKSLIYSFSSWFLLIIPVIFGCTDPDLPVVSVVEITDVTLTSITIKGDVSNDGGGYVSARGVCWGTKPNPTVADNLTCDGKGGGYFTSVITGLMPNTTYYIRAYATNRGGTS